MLPSSGRYCCFSDFPPVYVISLTGMSETASKESSTYARLGASSSKDGVHKALQLEEQLYFVEVAPDVAGDEDYLSLLHADGAGTKSIVAYLCYRETGDSSYFRGLAQDAVVMNLDDVACINAFEGLTLSNTIGRNRLLIPDEAVGAVIDGYRECIAALNTAGVPITLNGGETADMGDVVRTLIIDSTLFARVRKDNVISFNRLTAGDVLIGLSSTGQASYESRPNSGMGSNGLTLARHALIANRYREKYPEIVDPALSEKDTYLGTDDLLAHDQSLGMSIGDALLSPTRSYAPIIKQVCEKLGSKIHGIFHCTGGGQTKPVRFGNDLHYVKDNLFDCPPLFKRIQEAAKVPWSEMYAVFNMGHRLEIACEESAAAEIIATAAHFQIEAQQIGHIKSHTGKGNKVEINSPYGTFTYS